MAPPGPHTAIYHIPLVAFSEFSGGFISLHGPHTDYLAHNSSHLGFCHFYQSGLEVDSISLSLRCLTCGHLSPYVIKRKGLCNAHEPCLRTVSGYCFFWSVFIMLLCLPIFFTFSTPAHPSYVSINTIGSLRELFPTI